jgi:hypothetical protein
MFVLDEALTSPDSPLSPFYVPRLLMFHRTGLMLMANDNGYDRPLTFSAISPAEDFYKCGGPLTGVSVKETDSVEDIMICNDAFCSICSVLFETPATGDPDFDLGILPFLHTRFLDTANTSLKDVTGQPDAGFEVGKFKDLTVVFHSCARRADAVNVMSFDGYQRLVALFDPGQCEKCKVAVAEWTNGKQEGCLQNCERTMLCEIGSKPVPSHYILDQTIGYDEALCYA